VLAEAKQPGLKQKMVKYSQLLQEEAADRKHCKHGPFFKEKVRNSDSRI
jgi:hypothetical protein